MIYEGSRYESQAVVRVQDWTGKLYPAIYISPNIDQQSFDYDVYMTKENDRLDTLAAYYFGSSESWFIIARANPEVFYPDDIPVGTLLRIPR